MRKRLRYSMARLNASSDEKNHVVQEILDAIRSISYGSVEVIIHDSKVVQIERKEKIRFDKESSEKRR